MVPSRSLATETAQQRPEKKKSDHDTLRRKAQEDKVKREPNVLRCDGKQVKEDKAKHSHARYIATETTQP